MSLLAPLYIAGLLAISLPIIFHLIRQTPQGRQLFSSLMFLTPSPPRVTRRSKLNNILLLILRAAALTLLAIAFARPFLNQKADLNVSQAQGKRIAILVDTSASMQRGDLWQQAQRQVDQVLGSIALEDEVSLFLFDKQVRPAFTFTQWNQLDASRRAPMLQASLKEAHATWASTNLGSALATVADQLTEGEGSQQASDKIARQIVLISDLQQGAHAEALQGHEWPTNVSLDVKKVSLSDTTNASVQLVKESAGDVVPDSPETKLRIRVGNQPDSKRDQFTLAWANQRGPLVTEEPLKVYVPPGHSQIVRVAWPISDQPADRLVLSGDDFDFDNTLYIVQMTQDLVRVVYLGDDAADDTKGLRFYLERAVSITPQRKVELTARRTDEPLLPADLTGARLVISTGLLTDDRVAALRKFAEEGSEVLCVLTDVAASAGIAKLTQSDSLQIEEARTENDFALLSRVALDDPLFAPFADSRFADFTKIHFWKHRKVNAKNATGFRSLASFDDGDPFILERPIGKGRVLIATSGWHPTDSQLALSTKFVPLIDGLLRRRDGAAVESQHIVLEPIGLPPVESTSGPRSVRGPDGRQIELASTALTFNGADQPGIYRLQLNDKQIPLAVNVAPDEGRTTPLAVEELEQWGARLGNKPVSDESIARQRQLQVIELENRQKLWRWLIVAVLAILLAESALAGRLAHRQLQQQVTT